MAKLNEYDIVMNKKDGSPFYEMIGIVQQVSSKSAYVFYFKYNKKTGITKETDSGWDLFENLELKGSLGYFVSTVLDGNSTTVQSSTSKETSTQVSQEETPTPPVRSEVPTHKRLVADPAKLKKKNSLIDAMSNDQILSYNESRLFADDNTNITKLTSAYSGYKPEYYLTLSKFVFTGNGKYQRNVLQAAVSALNGINLPQVVATKAADRYSGRTYRNVLVVSSKEGKEIKDSTKLKLAKERGWTIISEDGFLKLIASANADVQDLAVAAMKKALKKD